MRYSITTCICACFYTDQVTFFFKQFKTELTPKSSERQMVLQTPNFTASWVTRPSLQLLTTTIRKMQHQNQSSVQPSDHSFRQYSSLNAASTSDATVTAAHCPEVLLYDEVGAVSKTHTQTDRQTDRHTHTHTHLLAYRHNTSCIVTHAASQVARSQRKFEGCGFKAQKWEEMDQPSTRQTTINLQQRSTGPRLPNGMLLVEKLPHPSKDLQKCPPLCVVLCCDKYEVAPPAVLLMVLRGYVDVDDSTHCSHIPFMLNLLAHTHTRSHTFRLTHKGSGATLSNKLSLLRLSRWNRKLGLGNKRTF